MEQIITGSAKNKPGVLAHIAKKFEEMNINITSISAAETEDEHVSHITLVVEATKIDMTKLKESLGEVIEVIKFETLGQGDHYERELVLIKVSLKKSEISHIMQVAEVFHAKVVGVGKDTILASDGDDVIGLRRFHASDSVEVIDGGDGHNVIAGDHRSNFLDFSETELKGIAEINGGRGNDHIIGSAGDDVIRGGAGRDRARGRRRHHPARLP